MTDTNKAENEKKDEVGMAIERQKKKEEQRGSK